MKLPEITIDDAIHVKDLNETLDSVGQICDKGRVVVFTKRGPS